jgi:hypothetical protein
VIDVPKLIDFPRIVDERGNLSFLENENQIPFQINRTYWIYDVPGGGVREGRALINASELIVSLSGSFDIVLNDGVQETKFHMARSYYGLFVPKMIWRKIDNFSTNSLALVLTDMFFSEAKYVRNFDDYLKMRNGF